MSHTHLSDRLDALQQLMRRKIASGRSIGQDEIAGLFVQLRDARQDAARLEQQLLEFEEIAADLDASDRSDAGRGGEGVVVDLSEALERERAAMKRAVEAGFNRIAKLRAREADMAAMQGGVVVPLRRKPPVPPGSVTPDGWGAA